MKIDLSPERPKLFGRALEHYNAYLYSQKRETEIHPKTGAVVQEVGFLMPTCTVALRNRRAVPY